MFKNYGIAMLALVLGVVAASFTTEPPASKAPEQLKVYFNFTGTDITNPNHYTKANPQPAYESDVCPLASRICGIWIQSNGASPERPAGLASFVATYDAVAPFGTYDAQVTGNVDFRAP